MCYNEYDNDLFLSLLGGLKNMNNIELKNIINNLNTKGEMSYIEGATTEQVIDFEKTNGVKLPQQFKDWLEYSDGGELFLPAGIQLYGVAHKPLIEIGNEWDASDSSSKYITIGALSNGDPILCEKNNEHISIFNHEGRRIEEDEIYSNFCDFLNELPNILGID